MTRGNSNLPFQFCELCHSDGGGDFTSLLLSLCFDRWSVLFGKIFCSESPLHTTITTSSYLLSSCINNHQHRLSTKARISKIPHVQMPTASNHRSKFDFKYPFAFKSDKEQRIRNIPSPELKSSHRADPRSVQLSRSRLSMPKTVVFRRSITRCGRAVIAWVSRLFLCLRGFCRIWDAIEYSGIEWRLLAANYGIEGWNSAAGGLFLFLAFAIE